MEKNVELLIQSAIRAPSGDNCQPFQFKIENSNTIHILHEPTRAKHFLNFANGPSLISLGNLIEAISIEASVFGYHPTVQIDERAGDAGNSDWAQIKLSQFDSISADRLVGTFANRWTCREPFKEDQISDIVLQQCRIETRKASSDVDLFYGKPLNTEVINYFKFCELFLWKHKEAAKDFLKTIRFPGKESKSAVDGLLISELGVKPHEVISLKLMRSFPSIIPVFYYLGLKKMAQQVSERNYLQSGGLLAFSVNSKLDTKKALINVGRSAMRVWLFLNSHGYVVQPMTTVSLLSYQNQHSLLPETVLSEYRSFFRSSEKIWNTYFGVPLERQVVWAFRVGLPRKNTKRTFSKRLSIENVIVQARNG